MDAGEGFVSVGIRCVFFLSLLIPLLSCRAAVARPRTLYKPHDIENAQRNFEQYPWAQAIVHGWQGDVEFALQQNRGFFEELIPESTLGNLSGQYCPVCVCPVRRGGGSLNWRVTEPDRLTCRECGTVYPNDAYPETGILEAPRMGQTFTFYQTPEERALGPDATPEQRAEHAFWWLGDRPQATSFSGLIRAHRAMWAIGQARRLAKVYAVTGNIACAERAAWILDRFSRVYPNYLWRCYDGSIADLPPAEVAANMGDPATPRGGRFAPEAILHAYGLNRDSDEQGDYATLFNGFWGSGRLNVHARDPVGELLPLVVAYDLIREARHPDGTRLLDEETDRRIVEDLLVAGCEDWEHWEDLSNKGVTTRTLSAAVGVLLEQPERVRRGLDGFNQMLSTRYHFDGNYTEAPHYAAYNYSNIGALPSILLGYSDPPGYQPQDGGRLEDLNLFAEGHHHLALQAMVRMLVPGNSLPPIGDTYIYEARAMAEPFPEILAARLGGPHAGLLQAFWNVPLAERGSEVSLWYRSPELEAGDGSLPLRTEWFPGWHVGVLRGRGDEHDTALYLTGDEARWTLSTGHRHQDILGLLFYAFGQELVSDRGYFSGSGERTPDGRSGQVWAKSTLSHNLVVVDEEDQSGTPRGSNLELFGVAPEVEVVQASGFNPYPQCDEYRRTCVLLQTPEGHPYAVDFFRVRGGRTHQYSFHCNGSLVEPSQSRSVELSEAWSTWLDRPRAVTPEQPCTFTWEDSGVRLAMMLLNTSDTVDQVVIADALGCRTASRAGEFDKPPIQQILAENRLDEGAETLATRYAAVIVPYRGDSSPVRSARLLEDDARTGAMAIEVKFDDRTDYIISTRDQQQRKIGPVAVAGEFAVVSIDQAGNPLAAYLLNGTRLECGGMRLDLAEPNTTLPVRSVEGRTFHLARPLSAHLAQTARYVLAAGQEPEEEGQPRPQTGFEIEATTENSITVRDYPPPECDEIAVLHATWMLDDR